MSSYYDTMQVCRKNGHLITDTYDTYPEHRQSFCDKCGSETIYKCPHCDTKIKGYYHVEGVFSVFGGPGVPLNCHQCGRKYPWKNKVLVKNFFKTCVAPLKYVVDGVISIFKK